MLIWENIKMALQALFANKMRSLLTMLGIIIGIGSVIAIMTVSSSLTTSISDSFQEMGANNITVSLKQKDSETETRSNGMKFGGMVRSSDITEEDRISEDMISEMNQEYGDQIEAISIEESVGTGTANLGSEEANISLTGINEKYDKANNLTLLAGRMLTKADLKGEKKVILVSDQVVNTLFDGDKDQALWQPVRVEINNESETYYIVGVYEYEESSNSEYSSDSDSDVTTSAYIPLDTAKEVYHLDAGYTRFTVVTKTSVESVSNMAEELETFFNMKYYQSSDDYEISTSTMESMMDSMNDMVQTVSIAIAFIAGISLLVGGIGVMNIMLVSITERTREIGTRKALGAKNSSIRLQFIVESVVLCLLGGILGILTGLILGAIAAKILGYAASAPIAAIFVAVGFSMVIGVFFGYYPAGKAAKLDPIEALRYE